MQPWQWPAEQRSPAGQSPLSQHSAPATQAPPQHLPPGPHWELDSQATHAWSAHT
jgi:hypothetical protein